MRVDVRDRHMVFINMRRDDFRDDFGGVLGAPTEFNENLYATIHCDECCAQIVFNM